ncbi:MAG: tellurite resistance protein [Polyangiales bacterium]|jgi:tellurite resistance protein
MQDYQEAMVKSLVAVAWADGRVDDEEKEVIEALISSFELDGEDAESIREYAKEKRDIDDVSVSDLSATDRRMLLQHAVILSYVDGEQSEDEKLVLDRLVTKLKVPLEEAGPLLEAATVRAKRMLELL